MRSLYRVLVSKDVYVLADDAVDACALAEENVLDDGADWDSVPAPIHTLIYVPQDVRGAIPWGIDGDVTIAQWFAREAAVKP